VQSAVARISPRGPLIGTINPHPGGSYRIFFLVSSFTCIEARNHVARTYTGRGVGLVGRRAEKEWNLQGTTGSMTYPGTVIKAAVRVQVMGVFDLNVACRIRGPQPTD
jgi:hypothetical protein